MQKATIWQTKRNAQCKLASSQKALSACACSQLEARRTTDKDLTNTYLTFIKVWRPTVTYVLTEFRMMAKREAKETQPAEELYFFPRIRNKCFIFWGDPKETFWLSSEYSAVEQHLSTALTLEAFTNEQCWVVDGSRLCKAEYLQYLGLWGQPEGNHMTAIQSSTKASGGPWGRNRLFIFSKTTISSALREHTVHIGNNAHKCSIRKVELWGLNAGVNPHSQVSSAKLELWRKQVSLKKVYFFSPSTTVSTGIELLTQAKEPIALVTSHKPFPTWEDGSSATKKVTCAQGA